MPRRTNRRRSQILADLSRLSRDGWRNARPEDYLPLQEELRRIDAADLRAAFANSLQPRTTVEQISPFVFRVTRRKPRRRTPPV